MTSKGKLRRRASAICLRNDTVLMVRLKDPTTGRVFRSPPGGAIEDGESPVSSALRETFEETGYVLKASGKDPIVVTYDFPWNGEIVHCETTFFSCELINPSASPADVFDAEYMLGCE